MSFLRSLAYAMVFVVGICAFAQTVATSTEQPQSSAAAKSSVDKHLQALSQGLDLTADQQAKIRPILANFLEARQKVMADSSLSSDERQQRMNAMHERADQQVRKFLNDEQRQKLTQMEQEHEHHSQ